jgi:phytoene dehydrogenase-like protein
LTLPVELLQRRPSAERYDVAVVGAGIGGLVCASILARAGVRVALVECAKRPGGQVQTIAHQGFAVDLGAPLWEEGGFAEVLAAAGVRDLTLAALHERDALRVAIVRPRTGRLETYALPVPGTVPSPSVLDAVRELYGVAPRVFAQLGAIYEELAGSSAAQRDAWRDTSLAAWLQERGAEPVVAAAAKRSASLLGALDPDAASLAALARRARAPARGVPAPRAGARARGEGDAARRPPR